MWRDETPWPRPESGEATNSDPELVGQLLFQAIAFHAGLFNPVSAEDSLANTRSESLNLFPEIF